jgi:hypothetical protein
MTEAKQQEAGRTRFLLLPPLSAAERESERESERKLSVVLVEMFGSKGNYNDPEIEAASPEALIAPRMQVRLSGRTFGQAFKPQRSRLTASASRRR